MSCSGWGGSEAARQIREAFDLTYRSLTMNNRAEVPEGAFRGSPGRCGGFFIFVLNQAKTLVEKSKKRQVFPEGENHFTHPFTTKR